jgi:hypothetical protein
MKEEQSWNSATKHILMDMTLCVMMTNGLFPILYWVSWLSKAGLKHIPDAGT